MNRRQYPLRVGSYTATLDENPASSGRAWLIWYAGSRIFVHVNEVRSLRRLLDKIEREDREAFAKPPRKRRS